MASPNWANRTLFHGDNLEFLRGMNSESVHLIATDPPFNKGRDFHATPDSLAAGAKFQDRWSWQRDVHTEWVDQITDDAPNVMNVINGSRQSYGDDMGAFLCFMGVRLMEMRRVLREDGSIYLHCDPTASHYLKELMDAIFGRKHFRNEIVWCYKSGGRAKVHFPKKHDVIFWYSKSHRAGEYRFNYEAVSLPRDTSTMHEPVLTDETGRSYQRNFKNGKEYRYYLDRGVLPDDWWIDIQAENPASKARTGYPTQKPLPLYERIIKASSNPGDIVLDPFAGCATTLVAAERLGRQWVGIDIWDGAYEQVIRRLEQEGLAGPDTATDRLFTLGDLTLTNEPPERTDDGEEAAPELRVTSRRALAGWQRLSHKEIVEYLVGAQANGEVVICAGCGRQLEREFMELDHILPRSDRGANDITNRILLCRPCNGRKGSRYTLSGLVAENRKAKWLRDPDMAKLAQLNAEAMADRVKDELS